jgi:hypothetical protein
MNRFLHLLAARDAPPALLSWSPADIVIERENVCRIRRPPYDLGAFRVVLLDQLPVIEEVQIRALQGSMKELETVHLELSPPDAIQAPCIIDEDVTVFHDCPMVRVIVAVTVAVSKDLAITIKRGLYGRSEVGESSSDTTVVFK